MKAIITPEEYRAIYDMLDKVSPVPFDCGTICGAICCQNPDDDEEMGLYLLPGEEAIHDRESEPFTWAVQNTEEYDFPESWEGDVYFVGCKGPHTCIRAVRPIQCRTFPLKPILDKAGDLQLILNDEDLPYRCPMIEDRVELLPEFIRATYAAWKILTKDERIRDLVTVLS